MPARDNILPEIVLGICTGVGIGLMLFHLLDDNSQVRKQDTCQRLLTIAATPHDTLIVYQIRPHGGPPCLDLLEPTP